MRFRLILGIGTTLPAAGKVSAQINAAYRVKAALPYICDKFFEWPPDACTGPHCRRQIQAPGPAATCRILFTTDSESRRNLTIPYAVRGRGVLSMGESPRLADPAIMSSKLLTPGERHTEIA
jgi:hypothetical protein